MIILETNQEHKLLLMFMFVCVNNVLEGELKIRKKLLLNFLPHFYLTF